ncbi:MAG: alpha/beta hydrolase [Phycisphaerae bacterium]
MRIRCVAGFLIVAICPLLFAPSALAAGRVKLLVVTPQPDGTAPEQIYVSLSSKGWPEGGTSLKRIADRLYEAALDLSENESVQYKFMREQSWSTVEKDFDGQELANRFLRVPQGADELIAFHVVARWADQESKTRTLGKFVKGGAVGDAAGEPESTRTGDIRAHPTLFHDKLRMVREVHVWVPPNYEADKDAHYPVLYMQDGQNLFDADTAFAGNEWELDETLQRLITDKKIAPIIVVGMYNSRERIKEYTPFKVDGKDDFGGGDDYLRFVTETVKPFIDRTYRTKPEAANTAIGGASLGGYISLYAIFKYPDVFSKAIILSIPADWGDSALAEFVSKQKPPKNARIWLDIGTRETDDADTRADLITANRRLAESLKKIGIADDALHFEEVPGGRHNEASWGSRMDRVLTYIFGS